MEKKNTLPKILTIVGTVLVWLPLLAPFVFGLISLVMDGIFRFDYLMPAELGFLVFVGGLLLVWAAYNTKQQKIVSWALGIAAGSFAVVFLTGDVEQGSIQWMLIIGFLIVYSLAVVVLGIGGGRLWRDLIRK